MVTAICSDAVLKSVYKDGFDSVFTGEHLSNSVGIDGARFKNIRKEWQNGVWEASALAREIAGFDLSYNENLLLNL